MENTNSQQNINKSQTPEMLENYFQAKEKILNRIKLLQKKLGGLIEYTKFKFPNGDRFKGDWVGLPPDHCYIDDCDQIVTDQEGEKFLRVCTFDGLNDDTIYIHVKFFAMSEDQIDSMANDLKAAKQKS